MFSGGNLFINTMLPRLLRFSSEYRNYNEFREEMLKPDNKGEMLLKLGDIIEFRRQMFSHYAIYVGFYKIDDKDIKPCVIELVTHNQGSSSNSGGNKGEIRYIPLDEAAGDSKIRKNNSLDGKYEPFHADDIVARAKSKISDRHDYSVWMNNCEHFVTWARYGKYISMQVNDVLNAPSNAIASPNPMITLVNELPNFRRFF